MNCISFSTTEAAPAGHANVIRALALQVPGVVSVEVNADGGLIYHDGSRPEQTIIDTIIERWNGIDAEVRPAR